MRKTFSVWVLVLVLSATVFAGDIPSPPAPSPSPTNKFNSILVVEETTVPKSKTQLIDDQTADGLMEAVLNVLKSLLALF